MQYPFSRDEHAAMARHLSDIRRQLQDVSDLFSARYGTASSLADLAVKSLVSTTLLEHELLISESESERATASESRPKSLAAVSA